MKRIEQTLTSMEVAEMIGKHHKNLLADIRTYLAELGELKIQPTDFFKEDVYQSSQGKTLPCYQVTKKGCEFVAHKLTGIKGTEFTAEYINRFHEMQGAIQQMNAPVSIEDAIIYTMQEMKQIKSKLSGVERQAQVNNTKLDEVLDKVTINSRQKAGLINHLKDRLSEITGEKTKAADYEFRIARLKLFKKYKVSKWEELTVNQYNEVFADIDCLESDC